MSFTSFFDAKNMNSFMNSESNFVPITFVAGIVLFACTNLIQKLSTRYRNARSIMTTIDCVSDNIGPGSHDDMPKDEPFIPHGTFNDHEFCENQNAPFNYGEPTCANYSIEQDNIPYNTWKDLKEMPDNHYNSGNFVPALSDPKFDSIDLTNQSPKQDELTRNEAGTEQFVCPDISQDNQTFQDLKQNSNNLYFLLLPSVSFFIETIHIGKYFTFATSIFELLGLRFALMKQLTIIFLPVSVTINIYELFNRIFSNSRALMQIYYDVMSNSTDFSFDSPILIGIFVSFVISCWELSRLYRYKKKLSLSFKDYLIFFIVAMIYAKYAVVPVWISAIIKAIPHGAAVFEYLLVTLFFSSLSFIHYYFFR